METRLETFDRRPARVLRLLAGRALSAVPDDLEDSCREYNQERQIQGEADTSDLLAVRGKEHKSSNDRGR